MCHGQPYLQDRDIWPHHRSYMPKKQRPQRPVHVAQDLQLVEGHRRAPPAESEVAPHLQATLCAVSAYLQNMAGFFGFTPESESKVPTESEVAPHLQVGMYATDESPKL